MGVEMRGREEEVREKPFGGFAQVKVSTLFAIGVSASQKDIRLAELRASMGMIEMLSRRAAADRSRDATRTFAPKSSFTFGELAKIIGTSDAKAKAAGNRLKEVGLVIKQADGKLRFAFETEASKQEAFSIREQIASAKAARRKRAGQYESVLGPKNYLRTVPVPRRLLRHLAAHGSRTQILTALSVLSRSLRRKKISGQYVCVAGGGCSAGFAKKFFAVRREAFFQGIQFLEELGWLRRGIDDEWSKVRCRGQWLIPNLAWGSPAVVVDNSTEADENRTVEATKQSKTGPSCIPRTLPSTKKDSHHKPQGASRPWAGGEKFSDEKASWAKRFDRDMLRSTPKLLELFADAARRGHVDEAQMWKLYFVALAQRALRVGKNPGALFRKLVEERKYEFVSDADEETARLKLLEYDQAGRLEPVRVPKDQPTRSVMPSRGEWQKMDVLEQAQWRLNQRRVA
jgi:hypothetical protein